MPQTVYIGIKGTVIALDRDTGAILWDTKLKSSSFVTVHLDGDRIFASTIGEIFCLDAATGTMLWHNPCPAWVSVWCRSRQSAARRHTRRSSESIGTTTQQIRSRPRVRCTCVQ